jgi:hypothetical protein
MQSTQEVNWLAVLLPSIVTGLFGIVIYYFLARKIKNYEATLSADLKSYDNSLNKRLEDYKKEIIKEIENYKVQLQFEFQTHFYQFQTRYSLLHQKKSEAYVKLFELLAKVQNDIKIWANWGVNRRFDTKQDFFKSMVTNLNNLTNFYDENRIFFNTEIREDVLKLVTLISRLHPDEGLLSVDFNQIRNEPLNEIIVKNIEPIMGTIDSKIQNILAADSPTYQLLKKENYE